MNPQLAPVVPPPEAWSNPQLRILEPRVSHLRWTALGDSFTAPSDGLEGWTVTVADELEAAGTSVDLLNVARAGAMSDDVLTRQLPVALAADPDLVSVICGANDVIRSVRPDLAGFAERYRGLLRSLARCAPAATVITATYPDIGGSLPLRDRSRRRVEAGLRAVNDIVRDAGREFGAEVLELADHPGRLQPGNFAADRVHPSRAGHLQAAASFIDLLRETLPIERGPIRPDPNHHLEELSR